MIIRAPSPVSEGSRYHNFGTNIFCSLFPKSGFSFKHFWTPD